MRPPDDTRRGLAYTVTAYLVWGLFPLYWPLLKPAGALEILADRMLWSLIFVALLLTVRRGWPEVRRIAGHRRQLLRLALAAALVTLNWGIYIWGVNTGHVVETSLGYFINPLLTILLGVLVLAERLSQLQWTAVGIATLAIVVLTVDYGRLPWIALSLAASFAGYGFLKKRVSAGAMQTLAIETAVFAGPALLALLVLARAVPAGIRPARGRQCRVAGRYRRGHRDSAAAVRSRRPSAAAEHHGTAAVPHPGDAVRDRGGHPA